MITEQNIAAITVLNEAITEKCAQCINSNNPKLIECLDYEQKALDLIGVCNKSECGLYSVRFKC